MKKLTLPLLMCVLVIGALVWGLTDPTAGDGIDRTDPNGAASTGDSSDPLTGDQNHGGRTKVDPSRNGGTPSRDNLPSQKFTVRGRCVDAQSKLPIYGCAVEIAAVMKQYGPVRQVELPTANVFRVRTGSDGRFEVELDVPNRHQVRIHTKIDRHADMEGFLRPRRVRILDAGDIHIPPGSRLSATVVDERGVRQPDVSVRLYRRVTGRRSAIAPVNWINATSDLSGMVEVDVALTSGRWNVVAQNNVELIEPRGQLEIPEHESILQTKFVVKLPDPQGMITGSLQNEQGKPIPNIAIQATGGGPWPTGYGQTDLEGKFQVRCRTKPGEPVQLSVLRASGYEPLTTSESYPWGSTNVTLTLTRAGDLQITVLAKDDDSAIEDYRVVWFTANVRGTWLPRGRGRMGHHPHGKSKIAAVPAGRIRIVVLPLGKVFAPNEPREFLNTSGRSEVEIALERRVDLPVTVVDGRRKPVAGTRLQLVRSLDGKPVSLGSYGIDYSQLGRFGQFNSQVIQLDDTKTDAGGRATLRWHATDAVLAIRVLGPGHVPTVHAPVSIRAENMPITIVVQTGATLRGSLRPLDVFSLLSGSGGKRGAGAQRPSVFLTYRGAAALKGSYRKKYRTIDAKGQFVITGLAAGRWDITLRVMHMVGGGGINMSHKTYPAVDLGPDEDRHIELDIRDLRPASLRGRVFVNNKPHTDSQVQLTRITTNSQGVPMQGRAIIFNTDGRGEFVAERIQAGRYTVSVMTARGGPAVPVRLTARDTAEVIAGEQVERTFYIDSGRLRVRLVDEANKAVIGQWLIIKNPSNGFRVSALTGKDGGLEIASIAVGEYSIGILPAVKVTPGRLRAPRRSEWIELGKVTINVGDTPTSVTLKMPKLEPR